MILARQPQSEQQIEHNFTYHAPQPGQPERYMRIREVAKALALLISKSTPSVLEQRKQVFIESGSFQKLILELAPASREQALAVERIDDAIEEFRDHDQAEAIIDLEEASMWANAAIARHEKNVEELL